MSANQKQETYITFFVSHHKAELYHKDDCCQVFFFDFQNKPAAFGWIGKQSKPAFKCSFTSTDVRKKYTDAFIENQLAIREIKADYRREAHKPHTLRVGDILVSSWGYDQTNIDFYEVVGLKGRGVMIRKVCHHTEEEGFMSGRAIPRPGEYVSDKVTYHIPNGNNNINVDPCYYHQNCNNKDLSKQRHQRARPWDGRPMYESWYA